MKILKLKEREFNLDVSFYQKIFDNSHDSILVINPDDQIITANSAACSLFGLAKDEFESKSLYSLIDGEDLRFIHLVKKRDQTGMAEGVITFLKNNGTKFPCKVTTCLIKNDNGQSLVIMTISELHERNNAEEKLREDLLCFQSAFDATYDGMWDLDMRTNQLYLSPNALKIFDYTHPAILNRDEILNNIIHEKDKSRLENEIFPIINGETDFIDVESRVKTIPGVLKWIRIRGKAIYNANDGSIIRIVGTFADITSLKPIAEDLKNERIILRTLVDSLPFTIYIIDKEGRKILSNKADFKTIGAINEAEVLGKTDLELFPGEVGERGHKDNLFIINNKVPIKNRLENFFDKDAHQKWLLTNKIPFFDQYNQVSGLIGFGLDITDQRNLQQKIKDSETFYRTLINISPDGIIVTDREGKITFHSKKIPEILDIPDNENLIGVNIFSWIAPEGRDLAIKNFENVLTGERTPQTTDYLCLKFDKTKFWIELSAAPLFDTSGISTGLMMVCRDTSARKKTEEDLISAKNKAEESDRLKSAFLRNISHEIRTPLNAILGFSALLEESLLTNEILKNYVATIQKSSYQLLSIVTDLIDISSVETKIIEYHKSAINLNELLKDIQNLFRLRTTSKNLTLTLHEGLPNDKADIYTDKTKLVQIISNLLSNAIKFTKSGHINFGYLHRKSFLEFYVSDTGIGIPSKYHLKIFDTFFQVDNALSRSFEGTGLGLSICKAYVELLGGTIWLTSEAGEGSTFFFTIPHESREISHLN